MQVDSAYYPVSLEEVESRVARKSNRNNGNGKYSLKQPGLFDSVRVVDNVKEIVNEYGESIIRVDGEIPVNLEVSDGDRFLFISYDQSALTHGLHKYPAKFFPELPRWLIKRYSKEGDTILDPFSGSGTTNLEALLSRRHSVGVDVDPFSRYLATVKTTPLNPDDVHAAKKELLKSVVTFKPNKVRENDIPVFPYRDNWFKTEITFELTYLKEAIESLKYSEQIKDFFRICFSSIIRSVSNADNNCTRTVVRKKLNKRVYPADALLQFAETVLSNTPKVIEFSRNCPDNVRVNFPTESDARHIHSDDGTFDLALTSPPYANAVDYPRTHQLEIYWLGLASGSLTPLKKIHVGTESVSSMDYKDLHEIGVPAADDVISRIFQKDKRRAYIAFKYLSDMHENLEEVHRVLKKGGRYVIVVGNNTIRGELFESWKYIMALAKRVGFQLETYFGSEIIRHFIKVPREERINTDWVLVLRKSV